MSDQQQSGAMMRIAESQASFVMHRLVTNFIIPVFCALIGYLGLTEIQERKAVDSEHAQILLRTVQTLSRIETMLAAMTEEMAARRPLVASVQVLRSEVDTIKASLARVEARLDRIAAAQDPKRAPP